MAYIRPKFITVLAFTVMWSYYVPAAFCAPTEPRGILEQATQVADKIYNKVDQFDVLIKIADAYRELGDQTRAKAHLGDALKLTKTMDERYRIGLLISVSKVQARMGDLNGAKATLQAATEIKKPSYRDINGIARFLAQLGEVEKALSYVKEIEEVRDKEQALIEIATVETEARDYKRAFQIADLALGDYTKKRITFGIAVEHIYAGQIDEAYRIAAIFKDDPLYVIFLVRIAEAQIETKDRESAAMTIQAALKAASLVSIEEKDYAYVHDYYLLKQIAGAQVVLGDLTGAFTTASLARESKFKGAIIDQIAEIQANMGDIKGVMETTNAFDEKRNDTIRYYVARAQIKAGDLRGALQTAGKIVDDNVYVFKNQLLEEIA